MSSNRSCMTRPLTAIYQRPLKHAKHHSTASSFCSELLCEGECRITMGPCGPTDVCSMFHFSILKLAWNLTCVIGHNALTQGAHCIQREGTPCIPYLKREWMTELEEAATCIPVLSWLRPFPASTQKTQIWQSDKIILLHHRESDRIF